MRSAIMSSSPAPDRPAEGEDFKTLVPIRRNELLGLWATARMGLTGYAATSYANEIVRAGMVEPGDQAIVRVIAGDFRNAGYEVADSEIWGDLEHYTEIAMLELGGEPPARPQAA